MAKKGQKLKSYSFEFKLMIVNRYFEGEMGYKALAKEFGITDYTSIRQWIKKYKELGEEGLKDKRGKSRSPFKGKSKTKSMSLEEENRILRMENEFLKKLQAFQRR